MKKLIAIYCLLLFTSYTKAQKVYEFNSTCQHAYQEITKLKLNNGLALIEKEKKQNPNNLIPIILESYADFFELFFNEDAQEYHLKKKKIDERIALLKSGPDSSPFYNFCLSAAYIHKAVIAIKFGETFTAGWDIKKAYQYIKQNKKDYPTFILNDILYGSMEAAIGTIPKGYKWLTDLLGMKGSVKEGMKLLENTVYSSDPFAKLMNNEASFIYCFMNFHLENKKNETLQFIKERKLDVVNNHLLAYMAANLYKNNKQTSIAKSIIINRNKSPEYLQTELWNYELGYCQIHHLEIKEAVVSFEHFTHHFKGNFYVKDVYQKLSWCYYLLGNMEAAKIARNNVVQKGNTITDADKQALKESRKNSWPNEQLLKIRMLNDGGYNNEALQLLLEKNVYTYTSLPEKLEYTYRLARVDDDLGNYKDAIQNYLQTIQLGENRTEYFAARAAWQIGLIYEHEGNKQQAINFYKKCLEMDDHDYKNSLDQKAKTGIARCKGE